MFDDFQQYGDVYLIWFTGSSNKCDPNLSKLPLEMYRAIEIGLWHIPNERSVGLGESEIRTALVLPSQIGIQGFDEHWSSGDFPTAHYADWLTIERLQERLEERANDFKNDPVLFKLKWYRGENGI